MRKKSPVYLAYLIRLWREGEHTWRGMLEDPHSGETYAFADVVSLLAFLRQQTAVSDDLVDGDDWAN